jgi:hypothetical protein
MAHQPLTVDTQEAAELLGVPIAHSGDVAPSRRRSAPFIKLGTQGHTSKVRSRVAALEECLRERASTSDAEECR